MSKIVFDSDGLIKMAKSGVLEVTFECFDSYISQEVFDEAVTEGKTFQFEDANVIEELIKSPEKRRQLVEKQNEFFRGWPTKEQYLEQFKESLSF